MPKSKCSNTTGLITTLTNILFFWSKSGAEHIFQVVTKIEIAIIKVVLITKKEMAIIKVVLSLCEL